MPERASAGRLSLLDAIRSLCDPKRVSSVLQAECPFSAEILRAARRPHLGGARQSYEPSRRVIVLDRKRQYFVLDTAWLRLLDDFRDRVGAGLILLRGHRVESDRPASAELLPAEWAGDFSFDLIKSAVSAAGRRYIGVTATAGSPSSELGTSLSGPMLATRDAVQDLEPETVAAILELHARHVVEDLRVNLNQPGWASVIALIATKMKSRASRGELRPTLREEAAWLADWAAKVAPTYDTPSEKRVSNKLGHLYRDLVSK